MKREDAMPRITSLEARALDVIALAVSVDPRNTREQAVEVARRMLKKAQSSTEREEVVQIYRYAVARLEAASDEEFEVLKRLMLGPV